MHRILHIIPTLDRAGAEKQLVMLAKGLPKDEFEVHVCALTRGGPLLSDLESAGIPTKIIGKRFKLDPIAFIRLRQHIQAVKPDLVQTWIFAGGTYGRAAAKLAGVKHLIHGERCIDQWKSPAQWKLDGWLAKSTDRIIGNTQGVREYCASHGIPEAKLHFIPNGFEPLPSSDFSREACLKSLKLPLETKLIGVVSRLWPQKRVQDLIWAYELVAALNPTAVLVILGDGPERARLERFANQVCEDGRVFFLGERQDVWRYLPHFNLFWNGSGYEGMPNSVMEAMAAEVPVVATNIPGNRDLVIHERTGFLAPVGGRVEFGKFSNRLLNDAELSRRMGKEAKARIETQFSAQAMIDRYAQTYREILNDSYPTPD